MPTVFPPLAVQPLVGRRVAWIGAPAACDLAEARRRLLAAGAQLVEAVEGTVDLVVLGGAEPLPEDLSQYAAALAALEAEAQPELWRESELWKRLGLAEETIERRLYTPTMLAELLKIPVAVVRRWRRLGLLKPVKEVKRLAYYDFQEVVSARRIAGWLAAGLSPRALRQQLGALSKHLLQVDRPLAQLSILVEGRRLLLRQGGGLLDAAGQMRFDFEAAEAEDEAAPEDARPSVLAFAPAAERSVDELLHLADEYADRDDVPGAIDYCRAALAATGPHAEVCFQLAELLYRQGDLPGARERYFMALEIDQDFVEARANLGCVLAEEGHLELAAAAFVGALEQHADYPDAHYHLARTLDDLGRPAEAETHWRAFLELAADSPWAAAARERLGLIALETGTDESQT